MIEMREILRNGEKISELDVSIQRNIRHLHAVINVFRLKYDKPMIVTSGYRDAEYNVKIGGSPRSAHCRGRAIDIKDDGTIKDFIKNNLDFCEKFGLYFEHFDHTPTWIHITTRKPRSGRRFFRP